MSPSTGLQPSPRGRGYQGRGPPGFPGVQTSANLESTQTEKAWWRRSALQTERPEGGRLCVLGRELLPPHPCMSLKTPERPQDCLSHGCVGPAFAPQPGARWKPSLSRQTVHSLSLSDRSEFGGKSFQRLGIISEIIFSLQNSFPISLLFFGL